MPIKEVRLGPESADVRMQPQKLQQSPGAPLLNPYNQSLGEPARGRPLFSRAVRVQARVAAAERALTNRVGSGSVSLINPSRPSHQEIPRGRLDFGAFCQFRLAASSEEVDQREAEDAQRRGDGEAVEEPPQVGSGAVEVGMGVVVVAVVKRCHPSVVSATRGAILPEVGLTSSPGNTLSESHSVRCAALLLLHGARLWRTEHEPPPPPGP